MEKAVRGMDQSPVFLFSCPLRNVYNQRVTKTEKSSDLMIYVPPFFLPWRQKIRSRKILLPCFYEVVCEYGTRRQTHFFQKPRLFFLAAAHYDKSGKTSPFPGPKTSIFRHDAVDNKRRFAQSGSKTGIRRSFAMDRQHGFSRDDRVPARIGADLIRLQSFPIGVDLKIRHAR